MSLNHAIFLLIDQAVSYQFHRLNFEVRALNNVFEGNLIPDIQQFCHDTIHNSKFHLYFVISWSKFTFAQICSIKHTSVGFENLLPLDELERFFTKHFQNI